MLSHKDPLTGQIVCSFHTIEAKAQRQVEVRLCDPYLLGTKESDSRPYHPFTLTREFAAFCKMNGFDCAFHDLRHAFATMHIASGNARYAHYVRTVASYLGHANVSMTLNTYADVDPEAKIAAVAKIDAAFDRPELKHFNPLCEEPRLKAVEEILNMLTSEQQSALLASLQKRTG